MTYIYDANINPRPLDNVKNNQPELYENLLKANQSNQNNIIVTFLGLNKASFVHCLWFYCIVLHYIVTLYVSNQHPSLVLEHLVPQ